MKREVKDKWIAALRSGKYKQGTGCLRDIDSNAFCCMGVLCDIVDDSKWQPDGDYGRYSYVFGCEYFVGSPPFQILRRTTALKLVALNDYKEWSFNQIADWIEENVGVDE